jgi:hypothetical protein
MDPQVSRKENFLLQRSFKPSPTVGQSWIGCIGVLLSAGFFVLALREGASNPYQRVVDSLLHSWVAMGVVTVGLLVIRRMWGATMPRVFQILSGCLLSFFALFTGLDLVAWTPLWRALNSQVPQSQAQALAALVLIGVWFFTCMGFVLRTFLRWIRRRYEHHGFAVGVGPLYFYFRRRRTSFQ